jgi:prevent-host-death family protein
MIAILCNALAVEGVSAMQKKITAIKARQNLGELLEEVYYKHDHFIITRREKAMAVVIPVEEYERILRQRAQDFRVLDDIWAANKGVSPQAVERDVAAAIREVRAKKKKHHAKSRS